VAEKDEFFLPEDIDRQIEDVKQSKAGDQSDAEVLVYLSSYYQADALHQQEALDRIWNRITDAPLLQQTIQESRKKLPMQNSQSYTTIEAMGGLRGARSQRHSLIHRLNTLVAAVLLVALLGSMAVVFYNILQHAGTSSPHSNPVITTAHGCTTAASCQQAIVTVTPNQVKPGGKVTVRVKGWVANANLQASIGVQALDSDIVSATSDAQGNFSVILTIDPRTTDIGPTTIHINLVNATGGSKNLTVQGKLTIIQSAGGCTTAASCQKAIVNVTPNQVKAGGKVTVTGTGWVANANLQASIGVQALDSDIVSATSDAQGNFSVTLTIDPRTTDIGPTTIHINLADTTTDGSKNLTVQGKLTIIS
jgi:hypothetical protein